MDKPNVIESEGKTIEEAIKKGLETLGLSKEDAEIKILSEGTSGLFGLRGSKPAKVRLQQKARTEETGVSRAVNLPADKKTKYEGYIKEQITQILNLMGLSEGKPEVTIQAKAEVYSLEINFADNKYSSLLIGKNGKTMKAIEVVMQSIVNNKFKNELESVPRLSVDVNKYKKRQEEKLGELVAEATSQVKASGKPYKLEPMPPYMRKVVHTLLQNSGEFETISEGDGDDRRVVISPRKK